MGAEDIADIKAREAREALAPVIDGLSTQVCVFDNAMTVVVANDAFCAFADSIVANTLRAGQGETNRGAAWGLVMIAAADHAPAVRAGAEAVKSGALARSEHELCVRIAGKPRFFWLCLSAITVGAASFLLLEQRDVTAQSLLTSRLLRAQRAEGAELLASGIAHDLNNLLLVINGYTDLVSRGAGESLAADREEISRAIKSASALTQQLLLMRPGARNNTTASTNQILRDLTRLLTKLAGDEVTLELQLDEQVGRVQLEAAQIQQVLSNLVNNACEAMPAGGRITVSSQNLVIPEAGERSAPNIPPGHWVVLRVHDTGRGMDGPTLKQAFDPFFTTKTADDSAGLGLSMVEELVHRAGGHVRLASVEGQGTTVDVYLPGLEAANGQAFSTSLPPTARRATLLVVEDNKAVRDLLQRMLRGAGYHVLVAAGPNEAREISESFAQPIHLLLTDVVMSDMSGPLLARELQRTRPELAVVLMSGYSGTSCAQREEWLPTAVFLEKPFTAAHVLRTVQEALDKAGQAPASS